jgi:hypothetical protein
MHQPQNTVTGDGVIDDDATTNTSTMSASGRFFSFIFL